MSLATHQEQEVRDHAREVRNHARDVCRGRGCAVTAKDTQQLNIRMERTKVSVLKEIAELDDKPLNQLVEEELSKLISLRAREVEEQVKRKSELLAKFFAAHKKDVEERENDPGQHQQAAGSSKT